MVQWLSGAHNGDAQPNLLGLKEKLLTALRGGIKTVLIPEENAKDLAEIPETVKNNLEIVPISQMDEALKIVLTEMPQAIEWDESQERSGTSTVSGEEEAPAGVTAH